MTRQEFIEKINEYNYTDRQINNFLKLIDEMQKDGMELSYEEIALERREDDSVVETR